MTSYHIIAEHPNSTVVAEYTPVKKNARHYQSEDALERELIRLLQGNGYEYLNITRNDDLLQNLRSQLSKLNKTTFSDAEWRQMLNQYLTNKNESIEDKTYKVQEDYIYSLQRDDGTTKNVRIIDKDNIHNNSVQVINQYKAESAYKNRYDVTILINGLPMVHIELKRRGVAIREAFRQITRYQEESFWSDSGLFEYIQLFIISNGTYSKYYANTTRHGHIKGHKGKSSKKKTSNSFEFTCWWTDAKNNKIADLVDFSKTFLSKHTLLAVLTKYCVFTSDKLLLAMRPYQIVAAESIINRIETATNYKKLGTIDAGGYIWHTTGSGKTLTSFKTAQLATKIDGVDKVLFVVDRKDLDYQTMKEYDKFQKGCANSNTTTTILTQQMGDSNAKIIITTIQKLSRFIGANKGHKIFDGHIVLIFDECHRSQFGDMHASITKAFRNYHLFGFTGTPIFPYKDSSKGNPYLKTTEQAFGDQLHSYTIVNAINDGNVLPFRIDYINTMKTKDGIKDKPVRAIDEKAAISHPKRIQEITNYIIEHFDQKTRRNDGCYAFDRLTNVEAVVADKRKSKGVKEQREKIHLRGFNSIFAVSSTDMARRYYNAFKSLNSRLTIATIFSLSANEEELESVNGLLPEEGFDTSELDQTSRDFLERAIGDYNAYFGTSYDTSAVKFENYYKDVAQRMKNYEVDLLIVVNMFLTGFDAPTLNTLWVDKNLSYHGLVQAFSRTNRILNSVKTYGNIICFRDLEKNTNEALGRFGEKKGCGTVLLRSFKEYYKGWEAEGASQKGYVDMIAELQDKFALPLAFESEQREKEFIKQWGAILRRRNILVSFDAFTEKKWILSAQDIQNYEGTYLDLRDKYRPQNKADKENINDDIEFEIELMKQVTVNVDYILEMVSQYHKSDMKDKDLLSDIHNTIRASIDLRSKKELIENFINTLNKNSDVYKDWHAFREKNKEQELEQIIKAENLKPAETKKYIKNAFRDGEIKSTGTDFANILPPASMFDKDKKRDQKKAKVLEKIRAFFERYLWT